MMETRSAKINSAWSYEMAAEKPLAKSRLILDSLARKGGML